jgi:hypothetical protein
LLGNLSYDLLRIPIKPCSYYDDDDIDDYYYYDHSSALTLRPPR